jgi:hypothetical protein
MKKFILGIIMVLTMVACCETNSNYYIERGDNAHRIRLASGHDSYVETMQYNGHEYVIFVKYDGGLSALHSPDCPCLTK